MSFNLDLNLMYFIFFILDVFLLTYVNTTENLNDNLYEDYYHRKLYNKLNNCANLIGFCIDEYDYCVYTDYYNLYHNKNLLNISIFKTINNYCTYCKNESYCIDNYYCIEIPDNYRRATNGNCLLCDESKCFDNKTNLCIPIENNDNYYKNNFGYCRGKCTDKNECILNQMCISIPLYHYKDLISNKCIKCKGCILEGKCITKDNNAYPYVIPINEHGICDINCEDPNNCLQLNSNNNRYECVILDKNKYKDKTNKTCKQVCDGNNKCIHKLTNKCINTSQEISRDSNGYCEINCFIYNCIDNNENCITIKDGLSKSKEGKCMLCLDNTKCINHLSYCIDIPNHYYKDKNNNCVRCSKNSCFDYELNKCLNNEDILASNISKESSSLSKIKQYNSTKININGYCIKCDNPDYCFNEQNDCVLIPNNHIRLVLDKYNKYNVINNQYDFDILNTSLNGKCYKCDKDSCILKKSYITLIDKLDYNLDNVNLCISTIRFNNNNYVKDSNGFCDINCIDKNNCFIQDVDTNQKVCVKKRSFEKKDSNNNCIDYCTNKNYCINELNECIDIRLPSNSHLIKGSLNMCKDSCKNYNKCFDKNNNCVNIPNGYVKLKHSNIVTNNNIGNGFNINYIKDNSCYPCNERDTCIDGLECRKVDEIFKRLSNGLCILCMYYECYDPTTEKCINLYSYDNINNHNQIELESQLVIGDSEHVYNNKNNTSSKNKNSDFYNLYRNELGYCFKIEDKCLFKNINEECLVFFQTWFYSTLTNNCELIAYTSCNIYGFNTYDICMSNCFYNKSCSKGYCKDKPNNENSLYSSEFNNNAVQNYSSKCRIPKNEDITIDGFCIKKHPINELCVFDLSLAKETRKYIENLNVIPYVSFNDEVIFNKKVLSYLKIEFKFNFKNYVNSNRVFFKAIITDELGYTRYKQSKLFSSFTSEKPKLNVDDNDIIRYCKIKKNINFGYLCNFLLITIDKCNDIELDVFFINNIFVYLSNNFRGTSNINDNSFKINNMYYDIPYNLQYNKDLIDNSDNKNVNNNTDFLINGNYTIDDKLNNLLLYNFKFNPCIETVSNITDLKCKISKILYYSIKFCADRNCNKTDLPNIYPGIILFAKLTLFKFNSLNNSSSLKEENFSIKPIDKLDDKLIYNNVKIESIKSILFDETDNIYQTYSPRKLNILNIKQLDNEFIFSFEITEESIFVDAKLNLENKIKLYTYVKIYNREISNMIVLNDINNSNIKNNLINNEHRYKKETFDLNKLYNYTQYNVFNQTKLNNNSKINDQSIIEYVNGNLLELKIPSEVFFKFNIDIFNINNINNKLNKTDNSSSKTSITKDNYDTIISDNDYNTFEKSSSNLNYDEYEYTIENTKNFTFKNNNISNNYKFTNNFNSSLNSNERNNTTVKIISSVIGGITLIVIISILIYCFAVKKKETITSIDLKSIQPSENKLKSEDNNLDIIKDYEYDIYNIGNNYKISNIDKTNLKTSVLKNIHKTNNFFNVNDSNKTNENNHFNNNMAKSNNLLIDLKNTSNTEKKLYDIDYKKVKNNLDNFSLNNNLNKNNVPCNNNNTNLKVNIKTVKNSEYIENNSIYNTSCDISKTLSNKNNCSYINYNFAESPNSINIEINKN